MFSISDLLVELSVSGRVQQFDHAFPDQPLGVQRHRTDVRSQDDVGQLREARDGPLAFDLVHVERGTGDGPAAA